MSRVEAVGLLLVMLLAIYGVMYLSWTRRGRRHGSAAVATAASESFRSSASSATGTPGAVSSRGTYISTTTARSRFDRVVAGGLGVRAAATMTVGDDGVHWQRQGAGDVHVEADRIVAVRRDRGMAGKFIGQDRMVVVTWRAPDEETYDTGFLPRHGADADQLIAAVWLLTVPAPADPTAPEGER